MNELEQAITKAKAKYEAKGYSVTTTQLGLIATKGIYKIWLRYYDNGQQQYIYNFKNGKYCGEQKRWYNNGQQEYILNYKNGKMDGEQLSCNEDGTQRPLQLWENGKFIKNI